MKSFATLLALGLVCGAAAANLTCVKTPAQFVANLETINYQKLNRPNVAAAGSAAAPPDNASMAYDLKYLLSVDQRLQRLETTGTFEGTWVDSRLAFDPSSACAGVDHFHLPTATVQEKLWIPRAYIKNEVLTDVSSYTPEVSDEAQAKILKEVRIAAGRLGRLTLCGSRTSTWTSSSDGCTCPCTPSSRR